MKHVPNVGEERKTARDGTPEPKKKNSQGRDPRTHDRKSSANSRQSCDLIVRVMQKDASENPRIRCELSSWKSSCTKLVKVVTDQFELRKCYSRLKRTRILPHRRSLGSRGEGGGKISRR